MLLKSGDARSKWNNRRYWKKSRIGSGVSSTTMWFSNWNLSKQCCCCRLSMWTGDLKHLFSDLLKAKWWTCVFNRLLKRNVRILTYMSQFGISNQMDGVLFKWLALKFRRNIVLLSWNIYFIRLVNLFIILLNAVHFMKTTLFPFYSMRLGWEAQ